MLKASRVAHQRSDLPRALVFLAIFSVSVCACDRLSIPTEPTVSVAPPASSLPPLPPAPPPAYTVSGVVTDGSSFGPNGGLNTGSVTILDGAQAGTSVPIFTGGSYTLRNLPAGSVTLEASSLGYRTMRRAVVVEGDLRADFSLPRTARTPQPSLAGTWAGTIGSGAGLSAVEFSFVQTGAAISGRWRAPSRGWSGTISGSIDGERSVRGRITVDSGCSASSDIGFGLLEYNEQRLYLGMRLFGSCGPGNDYSIEVMRTCRLVNDIFVSCG